MGHPLTTTKAQLTSTSPDTITNKHDLDQAVLNTHPAWEVLMQGGSLEYPYATPRPTYGRLPWTLSCSTIRLAGDIQNRETASGVCHVHSMSSYASANEFHWPALTGSLLGGIVMDFIRIDWKHSAMNIETIVESIKWVDSPSQGNTWVIVR